MARNLRRIRIGEKKYLHAFLKNKSYHRKKKLTPTLHRYWIFATFHITPEKQIAKQERQKQQSRQNNSVAIAGGQFCYG